MGELVYSLIRNFVIPFILIVTPPLLAFYLMVTAGVSEYLRPFIVVMSLFTGVVFATIYYNVIEE